MSSPFAFFSILSVVVPLLITAAIVVAVVIALRALLSIDRSLRALVEQGVARGEGPYDLPTP